MKQTGAVKNHFGVIPGLAKRGYHAKIMDTGRFANMFLDLMNIASSRISEEKCIVCGAYHEACPMKAIFMVRSRKKPIPG